MSKLDKTKTILDELRTWRNYAMSSLIALIAFNFTQNNKINTWLLFTSLSAILVLSIFIIFLQIKINKTIKELEEF